MKIHLTPDELTEGHQLRRISPKRLGKVIDAKTTCPLFFLSQHNTVAGVRYIGALITEIVGAADGQTLIHFEPVSAKAFAVYDAKTKDLQQLTLLLPKGQFTFTRTETKRTAFSLEGPGVDPDVVVKSWGALALIFGDSSNATICSRIVAHLKETIIPKAKAA